MRVRVSWAAVMAERSGGDGDGSKTAGCGSAWPTWLGDWSCAGEECGMVEVGESWRELERGVLPLLPSAACPLQQRPSTTSRAPPARKSSSHMIVMPPGCGALPAFQGGRETHSGHPVALCSQRGKKENKSRGNRRETETEAQLNMVGSPRAKEARNKRENNTPQPATH